MPPFWNVYVTVADADETLKQGRGQRRQPPPMGPMDVFDAGTMGIAQDAVGSVHLVVAAEPAHRAQLVNGPGTFGWSERRRTPAKAKSSTWRSSVGTSTPTPAATAAHLHRRRKTSGTVPTAGEGEFPAWSVWFGVEDCDASAAKATSSAARW